MNRTIKTDPRKLRPTPEIKGFIEGYALDYHTVSSAPTGDPFYRFDTKYTALGELLHRIKYKSLDCNKNELVDSMRLIVQTAQEFIEKKRWVNHPEASIDCVVPAPYSLKRQIQPVVLFAQKLSESLNLSFADVLGKVGNPVPVKNIDWEERPSVLKEVIQAKMKNVVRGKSILLLDDIFDSGATLRRSIEVLLKDCDARAVFALVLTRTRK